VERRHRNRRERGAEMGQEAANRELRHRSRLWARLPHHGCLGRGRTARFRTIDAALSFLAAFQRGLPGVPILCEAVQDSRMFRSDLLRRISLGADFPSQAR
jgi:hypothetical protein